VTKAEFFQMIMLEQTPVFRTGAIFHSLATAGDWDTWNKAKTCDHPYFPNDIIFACLYSRFSKAPTNIRAAQLAFMISRRTSSEWGYMIDPANKDSDARKYIRSRFPTYTLLMKNDTKGAIGNEFGQVFTEMMTGNGSLKQWYDNIGLTAKQLETNSPTNKKTISETPEKKTYYDALRKKYCGVGMQASNMRDSKNDPKWVEYVEVFKPYEVGLIPL
jgi:hypothetical protein